MVTQADIAAELGLNKSTVSRYVKRGMPITSREAALRWINHYVLSYSGGWHARGKTETSAVAGDALRRTTAEDPRAVFYGELRERLVRLPGVLLKLEPRPPIWLVLSAVEAADSMLAWLVLQIDPALILDARQQIDDIDARRLLTSLGVKGTRAEWREREKEAAAFLAKLERELFDPARGDREDHEAAPSGE